MQSSRLKYLVKQYGSARLTDAEWSELRVIMDTRGNDDITAELLANMAFVQETSGVLDEQIKSIADRILALDKPKAAMVAHRVHFLKTAWFRYAAAVLLIIGIGAYLWKTNTSKNSRAQYFDAASSKMDIQPGTTRAMLTLSNGRQIELDLQTTAIEEAGMNISNINGRLEYGKTKEMVYNTMTTPRGCQYQLILPDGSKVWLNAASSITYPTAFNGHERRVTMTGEVYFEIFKNSKQPFIVVTDKDTITVLGTSFNVNSYSDERLMKTSLVEGVVKVGKLLLRPGQAAINNTIVKTDLNQDVAWKMGLFDFDNKKLEEVMNQLSRWYDIQVIYEKGVPDIEFGGKISRDFTLQEVLKALSSAEVHYTLTNDKKLIVKP